MSVAPLGPGALAAEQRRSVAAGSMSSAGMRKHWHEHLPFEWQVRKEEL